MSSAPKERTNHISIGGFGCKELLGGSGLKNKALARGDRSVKAPAAVCEKTRCRRNVAGLRGERRRNSRHVGSIEDGAGRRFLNPIDDADIHDGFPGPWLLRNGIRDLTACLDDVPQARFSRTVLTDRVRSDEPSTLHRLEVVLGLAEPVDAIVLDTNAELLSSHST